MGNGNSDSFFCSQLVLKAFEEAGLPITDTPAVWNTPLDVLVLSYTRKLGYVGHLKFIQWI